MRSAPSPKPPARMRSAKVPCGTSSTCSSPAIICACVSGLVPMWLAITRLTARALISLPMATPGRAVSLAMTVRPLRPCRTSSSIRRWGEPTPMNPPIISTAPSGMRAAASAARMVLLKIDSSVVHSEPVHVEVNDHWRRD